MAPKRKRLIACRACHRRKVRCSGDGPPCNNCKESHECVYPVRDHEVKIKQRYLDSILQENERLIKAVAETSASTSAVQSRAPSIGAAAQYGQSGESDRNPIIENDAWFVSIKTIDLPVHIGEAADAAFATRLRQAVSGRQVEHIPRTQYMSDDTLRTLATEPPVWPSASQLSFLVDVALKTISTKWHIVRRSAVQNSMDRLLRDRASCDYITQCSLWALLAIGEVFSARCTMPGETFPGARCWSRAMTLMAIAPERPRLEVIEVYLLLAYYASCLNRRHTCINLASLATRTGIILGLHIEMTESQLQDPALRQHRCRLWWTAYRFDRMWASRIGWPASVPDDKIEIGMPSDDRLPVEVRSDFEDAGYLSACVRLASMQNHAVQMLYVRKRSSVSFVERVQDAVRALRDWSDALPEHLKLDQTNLPPDVASHILYLHLAFNQAVIVITRPILLHLLKQKTGAMLSETTVSLTTGCVRRARASMVMLRRAWAEGSFQTFDYFSTQFLFSAATIAGLSALLQGVGCEEDRQDFLLGHSFLHQLERNGNFGAKEFCNHVDALKQLIDGAPAVITDTLESTSVRSIRQANALSLDLPMQDFLNDPDLDLANMDLGNDFVDWQDIFVPDIQMP